MHLKEGIEADSKKLKPVFPLTNSVFAADYTLYSKIFEENLSMWLLNLVRQLPPLAKYQPNYARTMISYANKYSKTPYEKYLLLCGMATYLERNQESLRKKELFSVRNQKNTMIGEKIKDS